MNKKIKGRKCMAL